jgi:hypothetical protein
MMGKTIIRIAQNLTHRSNLAAGGSTLERSHA